MSNCKQNSFDVEKKSKHLPPTVSECSQNICCRCLDCRHICICANIVPSLTKLEKEAIYTCRSYECFQKQHSLCKQKNQQKTQNSEEKIN